MLDRAARYGLGEDVHLVGFYLTPSAVAFVRQDPAYRKLLAELKQSLLFACTYSVWTVGQ